MNLSYRNHLTAVAVSSIFKKPLDRPEWFKVNAEKSDEVEILIYEPIGWPWQDANMLVSAMGEHKGRPLLFAINSPGGDVVDAIAIYQAMKRHDAKVTVRIDSLAASSASVIAMGGSEILAYKTSTFMVHNPWLVAIGNEFVLEEARDIVKHFGARILDVYADRATVGKREIKQLMNGSEKRDGTWMTARDAKEKGFIDKIIDGGENIRAGFDLSVFAGIPDEFMQSASDGWHESDDLTVRAAEKALRDVGFSQSRAKAMLAGSKQGEEIETLRATIDDLEIKMALQNTIMNIGR